MKKFFAGGITVPVGRAIYLRLLRLSTKKAAQFIRNPPTGVAANIKVVADIPNIEYTKKSIPFSNFNDLFLFKTRKFFIMTDLNNTSFTTVQKFI